MKKGFTLIELLGVIVILGILSVIAIPVIDNTINQNKERLYQTQLKQIIKGAEDYYDTHLSELPTDDKPVTITLSKLKESGNLSSDIKNPKTNKDFSPNTEIIVTKQGNNFKFTVNEETIE